MCARPHFVDVYPCPKWNMIITFCACGVCARVHVPVSAQRATIEIDETESCVSPVTTTAPTINKNILWFMASGEFPPSFLRHASWIRYLPLVFASTIMLKEIRWQKWCSFDCVRKKNAISDLRCLELRCHRPTWKSHSKGSRPARVENDDERAREEPQHSLRYRKILPRLYFIVPEKGFT